MRKEERTRARAGVMRILLDGQAVAPRDIAARFGVDVSFVSRIAKNLDLRWDGMKYVPREEVVHDD